MTPLVFDSDEGLALNVATTPAWLKDAAPQIYVMARWANASRALRISFPTVAAMLGESAFDALVARFALQCPHTQSDWGQWGAALPAWLADQAALASWPYLPDVAQLDWLIHTSERSRDSKPDLGMDASTSRFLRLADDVRVMSSAYPIHAIWWAHHGPVAERHAWWAQAKVPLPDGEIQHVLIHRQPWRSTPSVLPDSTHTFVAAVLAGLPLAQCLDIATPLGFNLVEWLPAALQAGVVTGLSE